MFFSPKMLFSDCLLVLKSIHFPLSVIRQPLEKQPEFRHDPGDSRRCDFSLHEVAGSSVLCAEVSRVKQKPFEAMAQITQELPYTELHSRVPNYSACVGRN